MPRTGGWDHVKKSLKAKTISISNSKGFLSNSTRDSKLSDKQVEDLLIICDLALSSGIIDQKLSQGKIKEMDRKTFDGYRSQLKNILGDQIKNRRRTSDNQPSNRQQLIDEVFELYQWLYQKKVFVIEYDRRNFEMMGEKELMDTILRYNKLQKQHTNR